MFRYIAVVWNGAAASETAVVQRVRQQLALSPLNWSAVFEAPGLLVLCSECGVASRRAHQLDDDAGVIVGALFPDTALGSAATESIRASRGRKLCESYWGRYVAFLRESNGRRSWVVRDPSGVLPCFRMRASGAEVFFS